ncbi:MAG: hypothetical protein ACR2PX_06445 [Endozoicomonas sp.]
MKIFLLKTVYLVVTVVFVSNTFAAGLIQLPLGVLEKKSGVSTY